MEYKVVSARVSDPANSLFKQTKMDKASCEIINCSNSENCGLYKRNECAWIRPLGWQRCPYGKVSEEEGFTKAAGKYRTWIKEHKERYAEVLNKLSSYTDRMALVGDYVFLPYAHITMNESVPFLAKGGLFSKENCFLPLSSFNVKAIISICDFRPHALMGGEITSYQKEVVPKFLKHLSEAFPDLHADLCKQYDRAKLITDNFNHAGRKALLSTVIPNVGVLTDIHGGNWVWDGEYLTSYNSASGFFLVSKWSEVRLKPDPNSIVKIASNDQVNANTVFQD